VGDRIEEACLPAGFLEDPESLLGLDNPIEQQTSNDELLNFPNGQFSSSPLAFCLWLASLTDGDCWAYGSAFVVLVGVVGESIAELTKWVKPECRAKRLAKMSALLLILGLAGDLVAIHMTQLATASLNQEAGEANERAANLERESLLLQQQLVAQGSRSVLLYGKRRDRLIAHLKPFAGQKAEVRYCGASFTEYFIDNEAMALAVLLRSILSNDGKWSVNPLTRENCSGTGIRVSVNPKAPDPVRKAADALWLALHEVPLAMIGDKAIVMESPRPEQPKTIDCGTTSNCENKEVVFPPLGRDTIVITVLAHPL
jgi:hypothetical protein